MNNYQYLKFEQRESGLGILTISAPRSLNALNSTIIAELDDFCSTLDCQQTRVLILTGDGDRSFVAVPDISDMTTKTPAEAL